MTTWVRVLVNAILGVVLVLCSAPLLLCMLPLHRRVWRLYARLTR